MYPEAAKRSAFPSANQPWQDFAPGQPRSGGFTVTDLDMVGQQKRMADYCGRERFIGVSLVPHFRLQLLEEVLDHDQIATLLPLRPQQLLERWVVAAGLEVAVKPASRSLTTHGLWGLFSSARREVVHV